MGYGAFRREYDSLMADSRAGKLGVAALADRVVQVREVYAALSADDQARAAGELDRLEQMLQTVRRHQAPDYPLYREASAIFAAANSPEGPAPQRAERARDGIRRLNTLAERTDDDGERSAVLALTEPLARLAAALDG
jgi:hypothetical protein